MADKYYVSFTTDRKINLIREIRPVFGIGLKEAKDAVELGMNTDDYGIKLCREIVDKVPGSIMHVSDPRESVQTFIPPLRPSADPAIASTSSLDILVQQIIAEKVREAVAPLLVELNTCKRAISALTQRVKPLERAITGDVDLLDLDE